MNTYQDHLRRQCLWLLSEKSGRQAHSTYEDLLARVQKAADAVLKLASTSASISSIVKASLDQTQIQVRSSELCTRLNKTVSLAEQTLNELLELKTSLTGRPATITDRIFANDVLNLNLRSSFKPGAGHHIIRFKALPHAFRLPLTIVDHYRLFVIKAGLSDEDFTTLTANHLMEDIPSIKVPAVKGVSHYSVTIVDSTATDTSGEKLIPGQEYSIIAGASLSMEYKKLVNDFCDWFSAPSAPFYFRQPVNTKRPADLVSDEGRRLRALARKLKSLCDKTIFSAALTSKLILQVIKMKSVNPLISDQLVSMLNSAGTEADTAVKALVSTLEITRV